MAEMYLEMTKLFFIIGGLVALILGVLLWFVPETVGKMSHGGNKWYSSRKSTKKLDVMRETDSFYFAYNQWVGIGMFLLSALALYLIVTRMPSARDAVEMLGGDQDAIGLGILLDALRWILIVFIVLGAPVWLFLAFAPETLKKINKTLNTWVSTRLLLLPLEKMNTGFDGFVLRNHRVFSVLFTAGSLFILFKFLW